MLVFHLLLATASAGDFQVRLDQGVGWLQGAHVGETRVAVQGLPAVTRVAWGSVGPHVGGGIAFGGQATPWLVVRAPSDAYAIKPNLAFTADGWLHVFPTPKPWFLSGRLGARLPFVMKGKVHRALVENFLGGAAALGVGVEGPRGDRGWAWAGRFELEGHRLGSFGEGAGAEKSPRLDLLVPIFALSLSNGGLR